MFPEIDKYWDDHQKHLFQSIEGPINVAIDGQCDNPGYNATYCTVSAMDLSTENFLQFHVVDVKEVKNSQGGDFYIHFILSRIKTKRYKF